MMSNQQTTRVELDLRLCLTNVQECCRAALDVIRDQLQEGGDLFADYDRLWLALQFIGDAYRAGLKGPAEIYSAELTDGHISASQYLRLHEELASRGTLIDLIRFDEGFSVLTALGLSEGYRSSTEFQQCEIIYRIRSKYHTWWVPSEGRIELENLGHALGARVGYHVLDSWAPSLRTPRATQSRPLGALPITTGVIGMTAEDLKNE